MMKAYLDPFFGELNDSEELRQKEKTGRIILWLAVLVIWAFSVLLHFYTSKVPDLLPVHGIAILFSVKLFIQGRVAAIAAQQWIPLMGLTLADVFLIDLFIAVTGGFSSPFILLPAIYVLSFMILHGLIQGLTALLFSAAGLIILFLLSSMILPHATLGGLIIPLFILLLSGGLGSFFCFYQKLRELKLKEKILALDALSTQPPCKPVVLTKLQARLTEREFEVACLVLTGLSNSDIAQKLSISENTVKVNLQNIFKKLNIHSRLELMQQFICPKSTRLMETIPKNETD